jgi:hypothetical protein
MGIFSLSKSNVKEEVKPVDAPSHNTVDPEKGTTPKQPSEQDCDHESLSSNAQAGVKAVQAAATVWTKSHLIGAYVMYVNQTVQENTENTDELKVFGGSTSSLRFKRLSFER